MMKEFIFDEQKHAEQVINSHKVDKSNIKDFIFKLAKYNYYVNKMDDDINYHAIVEYLRKYCNMFVEADYCQFIDKYIKNCKKKEYIMIDSIKIRRSELDFIESLNNIRLEKIAFVLLCVAKYDHEAYGLEDYWVNNYSIGSITSMARVHVTSNEKLQLYRELFLAKVFNLSKKVGTCNQQILFVSEKESDPVVLELTEIDYKELAYTYLFYKNGFSGYINCSKCGKLIRKTANSSKYCRECAKESKKESNRTSYQKSKKSNSEIEEN